MQQSQKTTLTVHAIGYIGCDLTYTIPPGAIADNYLISVELAIEEMRVQGNDKSALYRRLKEAQRLGLQDVIIYHEAE